MTTKALTFHDAHSLYKSHGNYTTCRDAAASDSKSTGTLSVANQFVNPNYQIGRGVLVIHDLELPAGSVIDSLDINLYKTAGAAGLYDLVFQKHTGFHLPIDVADYVKTNFSGNYLQTPQTDIPLNNQYYSFSIDPSIIISGADTGIGIRSKDDIDNTSPAYVGLYQFHDGDGANPPTGTVTYHAPGGKSSIIQRNIVGRKVTPWASSKF